MRKLVVPCVLHQSVPCIGAHPWVKPFRVHENEFGISFDTEEASEYPWPLCLAYARVVESTLRELTKTIVPQSIDLQTEWLHSELDAFERVEHLRELREGAFDALVGVNLLREGLDLPEVSLVAILDADKEGYLRSTTSLIQTVGRAARHVDGHVIMYADKMTDSMKRCIEETYRRRQIQKLHNQQHRSSKYPGHNANMNF